MIIKKITNPQDEHFCIWFGDNLRIVIIQLKNEWEKDVGVHLIRGHKWWNIYGIRYIRKDGLMLELTK